VGEGHIRTQPGKFDLGGPGFLLGRSGGEPVSQDYPGQSPWPYAGGTVNRVLIDVSGEPFADLAREAEAEYARQ
jgi:arylsulfatase